MKQTFLLLFCFFTFFALAQKKPKTPEPHKIYERIDAIMDNMPTAYNQSMGEVSRYIKSNFQTESDRIRAVYYWTANSISYDVENMYEVKFDEKIENRITRAFKNKKGVCFDFATIFKQLTNSVGINAVVVTGYTKWNKIKIDNLSHAWNAARVDNKWCLFDPTWGAGFVRYGVFTKSFDDKHFKVDPNIMINTHMPFDYLWQLRDYPITNQEFMEGVYAGEVQKKRFDFDKEIERYEKLPKEEQLYEVAQRIEKGGLKNQHVSQAYVHAKSVWKNESQRQKGNKYSEIVNQFNKANQQLNDFIHYRNKQFQPIVSDGEIKRMIVEPRDSFIQCREALLEFEKKMTDDTNKSSVANLKDAINKRIENAEQHLQFVNNYLAKPISTRKMMFYKTIARTR